MGTRSATAEVTFRAQATIQNVLLDGTVASSTVGGEVFRQSFENGINDNQINRAYQYKNIDISDGGFTDFNLSTFAGVDAGSGSGLDALGQTVDIEEIVMLAVFNKNGPGILEVQATVPGAASIVWLPSGYAKHATNGGGIRTGGFRMWYEPSEIGLDLSAGSSSVLRLSAAAGQGAITDADIYIWGRSDDDDSSSSSSSESSSSSSSESSSSGA